MSQNSSSFSEGGIHITVPSSSGQVTSDMPAFYNPAMSSNRDIATVAARAFSERQGRILNACDFLAATGIRGLRYLGLDEVDEVYMNDIRKTAYEVILGNLERNFDIRDLDHGDRKTTCKVGKKKVFITREGARVFLARNKHTFDILDVDPFGSPSQFLDPSIRSAKHRSMLCITATDTATLCGRYPRTCRRRYGCHPLKTSYKHENGIRILAGYTVRRAASMEKAAIPILSHATAHYYRIYFEIRGSKSSADLALQRLGWGFHCRECGSRQAEEGFLPHYRKCCGRKMEPFGPLWTGPLKDPRFVKRALRLIDSSTSPESHNILSQVLEEAEFFSFYDLHDLSSREGIPVPPTQGVIDRLRKEGFEVTHTHFCPTGIKSDAPVHRIGDILTELSPG